MTSKLAIKASKKDRPRSSEKVIASKSARKSKDAGTPENKVQSPLVPNGQSENASNTESPVQAFCKLDREINLLRINPETLKSSSAPSPTKNGYQSTQVLVKKKVAVSEMPKQSKRVTVARRAPSDAEIKLPNPEDYPGLRVDDAGRIIPHSILGSVVDFVEQAVKIGDEANASIKIGPKLTPSPWPEDDDFESPKEFLKESRQIRVNETRALENWERQMNIRKNEQRHLSDAMNMPADMLLMNQDDDFRLKQEERSLIDRAMPAVDYGKGYRVGSEFWKQVETVGGEEGIKMTLTQTERGYAPPVEHIGRPDTVRKSMGTDWKETRRMANIHYPWLKSQYLQERKQKLVNVIEEICPHHPYLDGLEVIGQSLEKEQEPNNNIIEQIDSSESSDLDDLEEEFPDPLADYEDVVPLPIFGPSLTINGHAAQWKDAAEDGSNGLTIRLNFQADSCSKAFNTINITNDGTAAMYFSWKKVPMKDPFGIKNTRPLQRFYFDIRNGVILPSNSLKIPLTFVSPNAGIFNETWELDTQPVLCGGDPIYVILRGVATEEDKLAEQRKELENELQRRQLNTFIKEIVDDIFNGVRTPPRPSTPIDSYLTEEELFSRQNNKMNFNTEAVTDLKAFHKQLKPEEEWDMSVATLLMEAREAEDDDAKETFIQQLNEGVQIFAASLDRPVEKSAHNLCYQLLCEAMDNFYTKAGKLRKSMGLPEKEFVVEVLQEEVSKKAKKGQSQDIQKGTPDKKLDPKKKDTRPTSSRGKTSGSQKTRAKEVASSVITTNKQLSTDTGSSKPFPKFKTEKKEAKSPLEMWYSNNLYIQLYDILGDVANRIEDSL